MLLSQHVIFELIDHVIPIDLAKPKRGAPGSNPNHFDLNVFFKLGSEVFYL